MEVRDNKGKILETYMASPTEVLDTEIARTISDILSDNIARAPEFGYNSPLYFPDIDVAVKTGTTNDFRDAWIIGYNNSIAIGVWAGNNDNKAMKKGGAAVAGPIWNKFINEALKTLPDEKF